MQFKNRFASVALSAAGISLIVQVLAFLRQVLIATCFGVARDFDIYVMVYAVATFAIFSFGTIFDSIAVPHLVRMRESENDDAARALAAAIFRISLVLGSVASLIFLLVTPLLAPVLATGFSAQERAGLLGLAWYFLPWSLICLPYYAAAARHKMEWRFNRVFSAEILIIAVSIGFLAMWHDDISTLPLAYGCGYAVGLMYLTIGTDLWHRTRAAPPMRSLLRNIGELFLANQTSSVSSLVDRHIQSFVSAGGIAAVNYSAQLVNGLAGLLAFREIFVVPLSRKDDRVERLERLVSGLILLSVPLAGLLACLAPDVVKVLFERGRFDAVATTLTAEALRINAFALVASAVTTPLGRVFQIVDRIAFIHVVYLGLALSLAVFGYLFVFVLELGVRGVALMQLTSGIAMAVLTAHLVARCGIVLRWRRILLYLALSACVSAIASLFALATMLPFQNSWGRLFCGSAVYGFVVFGFYFFARSHLLGIVFGSAPGESRSV